LKRFFTQPAPRNCSLKENCDCRTMTSTFTWPSSISGRSCLYFTEKSNTNLIYYSKIINPKHFTKSNTNLIYYSKTINPKHFTTSNTNLIYYSKIINPKHFTVLFQQPAGSTSRAPWVANRLARTV
jgi:hypothetical protein